MVRPRKFTDEQILDVARDVFLEHGPGASTNVVADAVGISQAALFKRFGTKEALMVAALMPPRRIEWIEKLEQGPDGRPIREQLVEISLSATAFFRSFLPCLMTLKASSIDFVAHMRSLPEPPPLRARRAARTWFQVAIDTGRIRSLDADSLALLFVGALQSRAAMAHVFNVPEPSPEELQDSAVAAVDALWLGLEPRMPLMTGQPELEQS